MTGWRIGFAAGPKEAIAAAGRLQSQNSGNPNSITQAAAIEALTGPQDALKPMLEAFRERNALVVERVRRIPGFKLPNIPQGAFYAFPNVSELLGSRFGDKTNHRRRHARGVPARRGARLAGRRQRLRRAQSRPALVRHFGEESERGIRSHRARRREAQALVRDGRAQLAAHQPRRSDYLDCAAILAIVATLSLAQRLRAVPHRYDDVDFVFDYGWWTDYSSGGDPWQCVHHQGSNCGPVSSVHAICNNTPFFVEVFSPLARLDQKPAFWTLAGRATAMPRRSPC